MFGIGTAKGEGGLAQRYDASGNLVFSESQIDGGVDLFQIEPKANGPTEIGANSLLGVVRTIRKRLTIAQINAGVALLPALPGLKYRQVDSQAIAYGGAVGATTTVDILATQSGAGVKLAAFGQAALTQSTVLRPGISGVTVLADGASFAACDANTGVTVGKTGSSLTTATGVDIIFSYALEVA